MPGLVPVVLMSPELLHAVPPTVLHGPGLRVRVVSHVVREDSSAADPITHDDVKLEMKE